MQLPLLSLTVVAISLIWWRWRNFFNLDKTDAFPLKEALVRSMPLGILSSILLFQVLVLINDTYRVPTPVLFLHSLVPICLGVIQAARGEAGGIRLDGFEPFTRQTSAGAFGIGKGRRIQILVGVPAGAPSRSQIPFK